LFSFACPLRYQSTFSVPIKIKNCFSLCKTNIINKIDGFKVERLL
jgi:hypothetical protein